LTDVPSEPTGLKEGANGGELGRQGQTIVLLEDPSHLRDSALQAAASAICITDRYGAVLWVNPAFSTLTGYASEGILGRNLRVLKSGKHGAAFYHKLWRTILSGRTWRGEFINRRKDGSLFCGEQTITPVRTEGGPITHFVGIMNDATRREQAKERLLRAQARLSRANRDLQRRNQEIQSFYHTLSHELKTPLTSAREFISILMDGLAGPLNPTQIEYLGIARQSCDQLQLCIDDLFDATRLETGKLNLELKPVALGALALRALAVMRPIADRKHIELNSEMQPGLPEVPGDENRLAQIVTNLLKNALRFTPAGGRITLRVSADAEDPKFQRLSVSDTGCGLAAQERDRLFDRLCQSNNGEVANGQGIGLGLYICRELVELHGGKIWVDSEPGKGSTFSFRIPLQKPTRGASILVVDDDAVVCGFLRRVLEGEGFQVRVAGGGIQALDMIRGQVPEMVILDLEMPDLDGAATLNEIRQNWGQLPVILHTGHGDGELLHRALEHSPFTVLTKPCSARQLATTVRGVKQQSDTSFWRINRSNPGKPANTSNPP
jgi:PAS domain S-box-containing protein